MAPGTAVVVEPEALDVKTAKFGSVVKETVATPWLTWAPEKLWTWPGPVTTTTWSPGWIEGSVIVRVMGGVKGPESLAPVFGSISDTLNPTTKPPAEPVFTEVDDPAPSTTSVGPASEPAGTTTFALAPLALPWSEPPDCEKVWLATTVVNPAEVALAGCDGV